MLLNGWTAIAALRLSALQTLLDARVSPASARFNQSGVDPATGASYALDGVFQPWQIAPGSAGPLLRLALTVASGTLTTGGALQDLAGAEFEAVAPLALVPAAGGGMEVQFGAAAFQMVSAPPGVGAGLIAMMSGCLQAQRAQLGGVFANVQALPARGAMPAQQPMLVEIQQLPGLVEPCLAIFYGVPGTPPAAPAVPAGFPSPTLPAGLALSQETIFGGMVLPALPSVLAGGVFGWSGSNFISAQSAFTAGTFAVAMRTYTPTVQSFSLMPTAGGFAVQLSGMLGLPLPNASLGFQLSMTVGVSFDPATSALVFGPASAPAINIAQHIPWYAFMVLGSLVGPVSAALRNELSNFFNQALTVDLTNAIQSAGGLRARTAAVAWGGTSSLSPQVGALSGALFLQGSLA